MSMVSTSTLGLSPQFGWDKGKNKGGRLHQQGAPKVSTNNTKGVRLGQTKVFAQGTFKLTRIKGKHKWVPAFQGSHGVNLFA